jgi:hypothetical protein
MDKEKKKSDCRLPGSAEMQIDSYLNERRASAIKCFCEEERSASRDLARIELSSQLLHVSEFHFFRIAYEGCFDEAIGYEDLMAVYRDFQVNNEVPDWARDYATFVLSYYYERVAGDWDFSLN